MCGAMDLSRGERVVKIFLFIIVTFEQKVIALSQKVKTSSLFFKRVTRVYKQMM